MSQLRHSLKISRRHAIAIASAALVAGSLSACSAPSADAGDAALGLASESSRSAAIIDGRVAGPSEISATVGLLGNFTCTGTLIAPQVVLTAAHCVVDGVNGVDVYAGIIRQNDANNGDRYDIAQSIPHPDYNAFAWGNDPDGLAESNDIAILILDEPVTGVAPVPVLPFNRVDSDMPGQTPVTLAGFGITNQFGGPTGVLYVTETPYVRRSATEMLAGGNNLPDSCNGDSGGPVYLDVDGERFVVGVTSRAAASSQQNCGDGGIYTLAPAFLEWIEDASDGLVDGTAPPPAPEGEPGASEPEVAPEDAPTDDGSCLNRCGTFDEDATCNCDFDCVQYDDCCPDVVDICINGNIPEPDAPEPEETAPESEPEAQPEPQPEAGEPEPQPEDAEPAPQPEEAEPEATEPEPDAPPPVVTDPGATVGEEVEGEENDGESEDEALEGRASLTNDRPEVAGCSQSGPSGTLPLALLVFVGWALRRRRNR